MWVGTDTDNLAAQKTYQAAGARPTPPQLILEWSFAAAPRTP
jgi:hypothetical protein